MKKLSIAYTKDDGIPDELPGDLLPYVAEVYLPLPYDVMPSGRTYSRAENDRYKAIFHEQIAKIRGRGMRVNVLASKPILDIGAGMDTVMRAVVALKELRERHGVDKVTVGSFPFLALKGLYLKLLGYEIELSILSDVNSREKVESICTALPFVDSICLGNNMMNQLDVLRYLKEKYPALKLKILVNHSCIYNCPAHVQHHTVYSNVTCDSAEPSSPEEWEFALKGRPLVQAAKFCQVYSSVRPVNLVKDTAFLRPEDLALYDDVIDLFKISGREHPAARMVEMARAYGERSYRGDLLRILDNPQFTRTGLDNGKFPPGYGRKKASCRHDCIRCRYCDDVEQAARTELPPA